MNINNLINKTRVAKKKTSIDLDVDLLTACERVCIKYNLSFRDFFQAALKDALNNTEENQKGVTNRETR